MTTGSLETYRGVVYPWQMDHMGHLNVRGYTDCFDQATWHLFAAVGITPTYLREQNRAMAALDQHTLYKAEVVAGEVLVIRSAMLEVKDKVLHYRHILYNAESDKEVARTEIFAVHIDSGTRKACPLPSFVRQHGFQEENSCNSLSENR